MNLFEFMLPLLIPEEYFVSLDQDMRCFNSHDTQSLQMELQIHAGFLGCRDLFLFDKISC